MSESTGAPDLVIRNGLVLPMASDGESFEGEVVIRDGRIAAVTKGSAGETNAAEVLDAAGAAVLPGFIQGHVHVVQSLLRHQADGLELLDWLHLRTWPYEAALDGSYSFSLPKDNCLMLSPFLSDLWRFHAGLYRPPWQRPNDWHRVETKTMSSLSGR